MGEVDLKTSYYGLTPTQVAVLDSLNLGIATGTIVVGCAALVTGGTALVVIAAGGGLVQVFLTELTVGKTEQGLADRDTSYWISQGVNTTGAVFGGVSVLKAMKGGRLITLSSAEMDALINTAPDAIPLATRGLSLGFGAKSVIVDFSNLSVDRNQLALLRPDGTIGQISIQDYKNQLNSNLNNGKIEWLKANWPDTKSTTTILEPNRYFLEFKIKPGDGWDTLEAVYGPKIRDLPEYGTIQAADGSKFRIEVTGDKLAEIYYSGKLRPGDKGVAIIGNGRVLSHVTAHFGEEIDPDSVAKLNKIEKDSVKPGQEVTVFSVPSNNTNSSSITSISDVNSLNASTAAIFDQKWQYNFQINLGPTNPAFVHAEPLDGHIWKLNPNGVAWNVNAAGIPTTVDTDKYFEQQRIIEITNNQTVAEMLDSSNLTTADRSSSNLA